MAYGRLLCLLCEYFLFRIQSPGRSSSNKSSNELLTSKLWQVFVLLLFVIVIVSVYLAHRLHTHTLSVYAAGVATIIPYFGILMTGSNVERGTFVCNVVPKVLDFGQLSTKRRELHSIETIFARNSILFCVYLFRLRFRWIRWETDWKSNIRSRKLEIDFNEMLSQLLQLLNTMNRQRVVGSQVKGYF